MKSPGVALGLWAWLEIPCDSVSFCPFHFLAHLCAGSTPGRLVSVLTKVAKLLLNSELVLLEIRNSIISKIPGQVPGMTWLTLFGSHVHLLKQLLYPGEFWLVPSEAWEDGAVPSKTPGLPKGYRDPSEMLGRQESLCHRHGRTEGPWWLLSEVIVLLGSMACPLLFL